jgi:hypothetical protein
LRASGPIRTYANLSFSFDTAYMGRQRRSSWCGEAIRNLELNNDKSWFRLVQIFAIPMMETAPVVFRMVPRAA